MELQRQVETSFRQRFGRAPTVVAAAPGRVNLIGEHIDYNDGFVLPMALELYVVIAAAPSSDFPGHPTRVYSSLLNETETFEIGKETRPGRKGWTSYVEGVFAGFSNEVEDSIAAFDAAIGSTVPLGSGLSSSAALEVAMATTLEELTNHKLEPITKALLCQKAEHDFAGVPCGIMDQFSSVFGRTGELMLIDCRSQQVDFVPFVDDGISILITNSHVQHELSTGEYAARRAECDSALRKIGKESWRDVTAEEALNAQGRWTAKEHQRARHVVSETKRTVDAARAVHRGDWKTVGNLMYASHESLRSDFAVSCNELDVLVEIASEIGEGNGVIGSRMTGGGFGGCTVSLVRRENLDFIINELKDRYRSATGIEASCYSSRPGRGAHALVVGRKP
ncbi:MAG: galactokinase [Mariniblastus sp.]